MEFAFFPGKFLLFGLGHGKPNFFLIDTDYGPANKAQKLQKSKKQTLDSKKCCNMRFPRKILAFWAYLPA
jgi:hypothetical protein